ncbi:hypothetical protein [Rhodopirellula sp. P2]|uniref:hypothetical protein n=1 Tax=Rhodopirellula sp. P2 TaxID=2127060 RepID=UPI0023677873|nr:hypothetical protein [Rhodopirellula sp. P2]WDQ16453.1 hypothetical protein PSR62_22925 [Rhodopirellula sp. P2]
MWTANSTFRAFLVALILGQTILSPVATAKNPLARLKRLITETKYHGTEPQLGEDGAMECLAEHIDWVEHHIDTYGSVVAKQPDIWGEARLTKHRDEYERMMFREIDAFNATINASISQTDSSFLAQAVALSNAAGATVTPADAPAGGTKTAVANAQLANAKNLETDFTSFGIKTDPKPETPGISLEPTVLLDQRSRYLKHLHELRRINEGDDTSDSPGYSLNLVRLPVSILPGKITRQGFGAEITVTAQPVISDDLLPTTFQNLVVNDVVDFLGLPMVRLTERLQDFDSKFELLLAFEAKASRDAAQQTVFELDQVFHKYKPASDSSESGFTADAGPYVAGFLENNLAVQQLILEIDRLRDAPALPPNAVAGVQHNMDQLMATGSFFNDDQEEGQTPHFDGSLESGSGLKMMPQRVLNSNIEKLMQQGEDDTANVPSVIMEAAKNADEKLSQQFPEEAGTTSLPEARRKELLSSFINSLQRKDVHDVSRYLWAMGQFDEGQFLYNSAQKALAGLATKADNIQSPAPSGRARRAVNPLNPSSIERVMGIENMVVTAKFFGEAYYGTYIRWAGGTKTTTGQPCQETRVDLLDARRFLNAEVQAAYELLCDPRHLHLYAELASPNSQLASQIRSGHFDGDAAGGLSVEGYRNYFFQKLHGHPSHIDQPEFASHVTSDGMLMSPPVQLERDMSDKIASAKTSVEALAWAVVVESALLNERLNRDVRKLANAKEVYSLQTDQEQWFFLPDTVMKTGLGLEELQTSFQSANEVFKEYVRVRWPIHVFAVDPVAQDQNVADVSQRRRELQFAMALGFATGQIGANSLTQFSREMETQIETVSLNRTIVGFGHGRDTFGWRFYPRVQALETPGTLGALRETFMGASRDYDLRNRKIEPGQRECVAVVLMPSFVPYADFDIRTNWFKLTNPKNSALTMKDSLKLSRAITAMRNSRANCSECQHLYREGELRRLLKRVDQLDRELPLQTQRSLVPYENTLGGFEMFNTGVTDLSPELIGWYGAPGINLSSEAGNCGCSIGCIEGTDKLECKDAKTCATLATSLDNLNNSLSTPSLAACEGKGTTLFLVGDNFSVHDTKVLAGGLCIPHVRLISRELMQVTIPHCVNTVELCENGETNTYVSVYIATPYGVTNHLHVPVMGQHKPTVACPPVAASRNSIRPSSIGRDMASNPNRRDAADPFRFASSRNSMPVRQASMLVAAPQNATESSETIASTFSLLSFSTNADATAMKELMTISNQLSEMESKISQLTTLKSESASLANELPQVNVHVNVSESESRRWKENQNELGELPGLKRLRTAVREQWRNCRDQLPGN